MTARRHKSSRWADEDAAKTKARKYLLKTSCGISKRGGISAKTSAAAASRKRRRRGGGGWLADVAT